MQGFWREGEEGVDDLQGALTKDQKVSKSFRRMAQGRE